MSAASTGRVRFTIAVEPDVHDAFADLAHSSGVSLSRCIGDWLRDTAEAAQMTTIKLREVRRTPQEAMEIFLRDGLGPETERVLAGLKDGSIRTWGVGFPPSSNTGGKSPSSAPPLSPKKASK